MTFEKLKKLRLMNIISYILMLLVNLFLAFFPFSGNSNIEIFHGRNTVFPLDERMAILNIIILIGLGLYTKFQSGNIRFRENISAKCLLCLGWTFMALNFMNIIQILSFQAGWYILTYITTIAMFFLLMVINYNISDSEDVMDEKFYVRNPFSLCLGYILFTAVALTVFIFKNTFSGMTAVSVLLIILWLLTAVIGYRNRNLGILIMMILINIANYPEAEGSLRTFFIVSSLLMAVMIYVIFRKNREDEKEHPRKMRSRPEPKN